MLRNDTLETIQQTAVTAAGSKIVHTSPDGRTMLINTNGKLEKYDVEPANRKHVLRSLDDLLSLALAKGAAVDAQAAEAAAPFPESLVGVWHDYDKLTLVFDDADRRDVATLPLALSDLWKLVAGWKTKPHVVDQKQLIQLVKVQLADVIDAEQAAEFVAAIRSLKFKTTDETSVEITRGREGLGKSLEQACAGADTVPEKLALVLDVYRGIKEHVKPVVVRVAVSIDFTTQKLILEPIGDDVADGIDETQKELRNVLDRATLESNRVSVYFGTP